MSDQMLRRILIWPAVIFVIIVTQIPLLYTLNFSLQRWNMNRPDRRGFIGLENYIDVITDNDFWTIIWNTGILTGSVVLITFVLGLCLSFVTQSRLPRTWNCQNHAYHTILNHADGICGIVEECVA